MRNKQNHILRTAAYANLANSADITCPDVRFALFVWKALCRYKRESNQTDQQTAAMLGIRRKTLGAWLDDRFLLGAPEIIDAPLFPKRQRSV